MASRKQSLEAWLRAEGYGQGVGGRNCGVMPATLVEQRQYEQYDSRASSRDERVLRVWRRALKDWIERRVGGEIALEA